MKKPEGQEHVILPFEDHALDTFVFPRCSINGSVDDAQASATLASHALPALGYRTGFRDSLTLHAARRESLLQVDSKYDAKVTRGLC